MSKLAFEFLDFCMKCTNNAKSCEDLCSRCKLKVDKFDRAREASLKRKAENEKLEIRLKVALRLNSLTIEELAVIGKGHLK